MEKSSTTLLINIRVLHYTQDRGWLLFNSVFVYLCLRLYIIITSLCTHIATYISIMEIVCVSLNFAK